MAKKQSNLEQVAEGLVLISESRNELEALSAHYNDWIDEAARLGEDEYSDQLINDKIDTDDFSRDLKFLELQIRSGAVTAKTFNNLKKIPAAINACKTLLKAGPDFLKLGKDISVFKAGLSDAKSSLRGLRSELTKEKGVFTDEYVLGAKKEESPKVKAEKEARELRLMRPTSDKKVSVAIPGDFIEADGIDIDAIIDAENGKKKP